MKGWTRVKGLVKGQLSRLGHVLCLLYRRLKTGRKFWGCIVNFILRVGSIFLGIYLAYLSLLKHDVQIMIFDPEPSQFVADKITVKGAVIGRPYDYIIIELEGTEYKWSAFPFTLDTTQLTDGEYVLRCTAFHKSAAIATNFLRFFVQNTPPVVRIKFPQDGDVVSGVITLEIETDRAVKDVKVFVNNQELLTKPSLDTRRLPDGIHVLTATAVGPSNISGQHSITLIVDNTPPRVKSIGFDPAIPVSGIRKISPEIEENNVAVAAWYVDGAFVGEGIPLVLDTRQWRDGQHCLRLQVIDKAGHVDDLETTFHIDNTPPILKASLASAQTVCLPQCASILVDATAEDSSGIAEVEHYINGVRIPSGWYSLSKFEPATRLLITTVARDIAGNEVEQSCTVEIADLTLGSLWSSLRVTLAGMNFECNKRGACMLVGAGLRPSFSICSEIEGFANHCVSTTPLWLEAEISPLMLFYPVTSPLGSGIGVYLNPGIFSQGILPIRPLLEIGYIGGLEIAEETKNYIWYEVSWIGAFLELKLPLADWCSIHYRLGAALLFLFVIEGAVSENGVWQTEPGGPPPPPPPPETRLSESFKVFPALFWMTMTLKITVF